MAIKLLGLFSTGVSVVSQYANVNVGVNSGSVGVNVGVPILGVGVGVGVGGGNVGVGVVAPGTNVNVGVNYAPLVNAIKDVFHVNAHECSVELVGVDAGL